MMYHIVNNLPKDCKCIPDYPFPFKFGKKLYVYEPYVDYNCDACWCRRSHELHSFLAVQLLEICHEK